MPKLYEYLGIMVYFYSHEHDPIHVHGSHNEKESKAEFFIEEGKLVSIQIKPLKGGGLDGKDLKNFETLVYHYASDIIQKGVDFFLLKKSVSPIQITKKIK